MNISISNIAWEMSEDAKVLDLLKEYSIHGLEVAPTKIWDNPTEASVEDIKIFKEKWSQHNIELVGMQSLLFGQTDLYLFKSTNSRENLKNYLIKIIELAGILGTKNLVFGSPKNRLVEGKSKKEQLEIVIPFFQQLGKTALDNNVLLCIEPNAPQYGCDFITNTDEAIELIELINHPGIQLHLDAAVMTLNKENYAESLEKASPYLAHFHISEPYLNLIGSENTDHHAIFNALNKINYKKWISIEMKNGLLDNNIDSVKKSLDFVSKIYK
ncbi:sugar phosphate isomerase/epimerase family protein [Paenibacillus sp. PK4536]|uniref:sugar phosphate isomerase/epimerase family protein n=1 Tax=Paenibacillus sp. PK4536 TaxID=3024576 RepID=UPI002359E992|nr:sugar phosphate isomerase/epimerase family protein [Paenibacillus sp. PK4536]WIM39757.1 sugar phosphate isomerase/epimerase family protein [Paenibacillus sp. PK4536]